MGCCFSVVNCPVSATGICCLIAAKARKSVIHSFAGEERTQDEDSNAAVASQMSGEKPSPPAMNRLMDDSKSLSEKNTLDFHFGCQEIFFDTKSCLDSDCDDFYSINGDLSAFHSRRLSSQRSFPEAPRLSRAFFIDEARASNLQPSSTAKKKRLVDLFKESMNQEQLDFYLGVISDMKISSVRSFESFDGICKNFSTDSSSATKTNSKDAEHEVEKHAKVDQCCMTSLVQASNTITE